MKPKTKKLVILFAALALVLGFAAAELQKSVRVVVSTGTAKGQPDVAYDAQAERYLVVWQERAGSGDDRDIRARVVNRDGTPASDIVALASSGEDERLPKTAATGSSSWTVVWSTGTSIEACTVDATGKATDFRTVDATPTRPVDRPDIGACSSDGAFLVVWEELDETGLTVIKGRRIRALSGTSGEEFLLARSPEHDLRNPSVSRSGSGSFVAWEKPVELRRADIEGRFVPADAASSLDLGQVLTIAADGARNTVPSVTAFPETDAYLVVWQSSDGRRTSDISFASVTSLEVQSSGKLTDTPDFRETRPFASSVGIAGRALITYQTAPSNTPLQREIAARTIGWGDAAASAEIVLDPTREGGGNPAAVPASGAGGRGLVVWDVKEGEGSNIYSREWLASELTDDGLLPDIDGPIVPLADVTVSGVVLFNGLPQAGVLMSGFPVETRTDATGAYSGVVAAPWSGTVTPVLPGFTFSPASNTYADVNADVTGQNYTATYVGGAEDAFENNEDFATAVELPLGTTHDLVLNDVDWFKFYVPASEAGKDLRIRLWGTGFPDTVNRRDLDFAILDASGKLLNYNVSGASDETAYICDAVEGYYYIVQTYIPNPAGIVYAVTAELSDAFGLGYITGHVTDDYGMPLEGIVVELYGVPMDWNAVSHPLITTDAEGYYKLGWIPGDYTLRFNTTDFGNDGLDWSPDENYVGELYNYGQVISLAPGSTLSEMDAELTPGGMIAGTITDGSGIPIENARAHVYTSFLGNPGNAYTDANGAYLIDRLWAGNYAVRLRTTVGPLINEWYDDRVLFGSAETVDVSPVMGATSGVDARLEERAWGTIAGRVTDAYGDPVVNLQVTIVDPAGISLWTIQTDAQGYYTHSRVPAGAWKVFFNARSRPALSLVPLYFPGTPLISAAQTVQVQEGEITSGIDAVLPLAGNISGQVLNNIGSVTVIAYDTAGDYSWSVSPNIPLTGAPAYTISCLPPGTYKVLARPYQQGDRLSQWHPAAAFYTAAGTVTVTAGAMTSGIDITLAGGGALIQGQVTDIDGFGIAGVNVVAYDPVKRVSYASALSDADGNYTVRQVPATATPGPVKIHFNTDAYWLNYESEYYNNKADYGLADSAAVTNGETTTLLDAVLNYRPEFAVTTASLPDGEVAVAYSYQLMATGGRTFYHWSIQTGALPDGLSMGANGLIAGVPTSTGVWPFTVEVTDSTLPERQSVIQALSITVGAYTGEGFTISGTVTEYGSPLAGVRIEGLPGDPVTSASGTYIAVVEPAYWDTVTPVLSGFAFDPPFRTYAVVTENMSGQNYSAQAGYRLSGSITINGAPLSGVRITGLPTEIRTNESGEYSIMLPIGWGGTVIPVLSGFTFMEPYTNYDQLLGDELDQDYTATYAGGGEDLYEDNDSFATAATVAMGTVIPDLVLNDQDWFKFEVLPGDAGKTLGLRLQATAFPNGTAVSDPTRSKDLDYGIMDATGKLLTYCMSGSIDEVTFIPDIQPGWYTIGHTYMVNPGMVYSLFVTTAELLPVGKVTGRVTNEDGQGIDGITVQLFKLPFDWNDSHAMAITDADGFYKAAAFSGDYQVKVGLQDFDQNPNDGLPDGWLPVRNYLPNSYDHDKTVILDDGAPVNGADVTLEWAGAISGRVTDGEGSPLQLARVFTYLAGGIQANVAYTDAEGNYEIRHLRSANYALLFRPPAGSPLAREWYNDVNALGASLPVPAVAETTTMGIDAVLETGGQITGHVRNEAGDPIQGVTAVALDPSGIAMQAANSQSDGSYFLNSLKEGSYKIVFNPANCYAGNFLFREYNSGEPVPVADGQTTSGIDGVMYPAGAIIGRLSDQDDDGLMNGSVQAFCASTGNMWAATIDYMGNYTIRNLPPDNYRVRFAFTFGSITNYPPKWYSDANTGTTAAVLTVFAGGTVNGIDGVLGADGGGISGRVTNTVGGGIAGISVLAEDGSFGEFATSQALTDSNGYYTVQNVPTGTARVFFQPGFRPFNTEFYNDQTSYGSAAAVPIDQDSVQPEINAVLTVRPSLALATTSLPDGELGAAYAQTLAASGGFAFYHWSIYSGSLPPGLVLNSRGEISGTPTMQGTFHFMVDLTDSSYPQQGWTSELTITVGEYTGLGHTVSGTVTADATPLAGVTMSGLPGSPVTNAAGGYVAVVPSGWNGTVRPFRAGYAFTPATITYANVSADSAAQDYTAVAGFTISGTVTLGGIGQEGVVMAGLPGMPSTDAAGGYAVTVPSGWDGIVTPTLPGFTFAPVSIPFTDVSADMTGQNFVSTYAGGVDDSFEDNDSFETAAVVPLGTTSGLVLRDEDWFKFYVAPEDAGKDLRVRIWGTSFPDATTRRDLDFYVRNAAGTALSLNLSGSPDETAYICDVAEGWYYAGQMYIGLEGTVYSLSVDLNEDFGLGYIEGTVRDDGGTPIPGVSVELYGEPLDWNISHPLIYTDATGHFRIGYTPGPYTVRFNLASAERDDLEWTPDANFLGEIFHDGEVLQVAPGATLSGIDGQLTEGGAISGRITAESGNPLQMAWVYAHAGDTLLASSNLTDADGNYMLTRLRTGNYAVRFRAPGGTGLAQEWYEDQAAFVAAMPVAVLAGETTTGIDAVLGVSGSLAGRVTNALGEPIASVQVTALDPAGIGVFSTMTDSNGDYVFGRLPSGALKVLFNASTAPTVNFVSEYYPDQRFIADAGTVDVTAGQATTGIDAVLALAGTISGRVTVAGGVGLSNVGVHAFDVDSNFFVTATTGVDGSYAIRNLPADSYKVRFRPITGDWAVEWWGDKTNFTDADIVTVASGATVSEIDAEITEQSGWITGSVTNGLGTGIAGLTVVAQDTGREAAYSSAITDGSGNYFINRFPTCQTKLYFNADTAHLNYVSEYHLDKADHASADAVNVTVGEQMPIIDAVLADRPVLTVTTDPLPSGELAVGYSATLAASGGRTLYHWSLISDSLPDGLTMNARGEISGMPTMAGTFWFTVRVSDSTVPQQVTTKDLAITVESYTGLGHTISGKVLFGGDPLAGVTIGGLPGTPVTNAAGGYVAVVTDGWTGTATPALAGHGFTPPSIEYSSVTADQPAQDYAARVLAPALTVTYPNGGESCAIGSMQSITWTQMDMSGSVTIDLYKGGVWLKTLGTADATAEIFSGTIGAEEIPGTDYRIRIWQGGVSDESDADFAITAADVRKDDLVGTWDGQGVYYRNSDTGEWVAMASPATMITTGDIDDDGTDDLIGIWPSQGGVWIKYYATGEWVNLSSSAVYITTGDMNGDGRDDLLGTWDGQGVYYRDSASGAWVQLASPASMITCGDLDNDGTDDLIGIWAGQGGVWVKYSSSGLWEFIGSTPTYIGAGDMNGDGRDELLGSWVGQGVYYRNSESGAWTQMSSEATMITAGDLEGDGTDDLLGLWPTQGGIWVKYSSTGGWELLSSTAQYITAGKMRPAAGAPEAPAAVMGLPLPEGGTEPGPEAALRKTDESSKGPGGSRFMYLEGPNLVPNHKGSAKLTRVPGPGDRGFTKTKQKNLVPQKETKDRKRTAEKTKK